MEAEGCYRPIEDALRTLAAGNTRVVDARLREDANSVGEDAIFVELVLADPSDVTWPVEEIRELRRRVRDVMTEHREHRPPDYPWYISFSPETDDELDPEDAAEAIDV
jgi:hypothetical protein